MSEEFITALCHLIQQLLIDKLHIIGDIFDRGPRADLIMDALINCHDVDIQWGNHDISWMGASAGNWALIANVIRLGISYNNFDLLEDGYGINLRALSIFADKTYADDPCKLFIPHILDENIYDPVDIQLAAKMHKAMAIIQFKVEAQLIKKHPEYKMDDRILLDKIDFKNHTVKLGNKEYKMKDTVFPTVDPKDPLKLTAEEIELMKTIAASFAHSERLQKHIRFLYSHGSMYLKINSNILYHGCIPLTEDGKFDKIELYGKTHSGKEYLEFLDDIVRSAYFAQRGSLERENANDLMWYLWCGAKSPLFGKDKLSAFERYFIDEPETHVEKINPYYTYVESKKTCEMIIHEFGLSPENSHIINGHVPVKVGENPVKADGLLFMIDGGISKAYQSQTGIGGYTFISNSCYLALAEHKPFDPHKKVLETPKVMIVEAIKKRTTVADTDNGAELSRQIKELTALLQAYRNGSIKEK